MKVQAHYFQRHPLGIHSGMSSRSSTTLSKAMRIYTSNGPHYGREGTKMCQSSQTFFIPFAHSWVSRTLSCMWYSNNAPAYTDTSRKRRSSWTSPHLAWRIDTLSKSSKSSNRRSETLDLQIRRPKDKAKVGWPKTSCWSRKKRSTPQSQRRTQESGVSSTRVPFITQVSIGPSSSWWLTWRLQN